MLPNFEFGAAWSASVATWLDEIGNLKTRVASAAAQKEKLNLDAARRANCQTCAGLPKLSRSRMIARQGSYPRPHLLSSQHDQIEF